MPRGSTRCVCLAEDSDGPSLLLSSQETMQIVGGSDIGDSIRMCQIEMAPAVTPVGALLVLGTGTGMCL